MPAPATMSASCLGGLAIILISMTGADTSRGAGSTRRRLGIAAVALWVVALVLAGVYFSQRSQTGAAAQATSTSLAAVSTTVTTLPPTTEPPTTEAPTTTTTEAPTTTTTEEPSLTIAAGGDVQGDRMVGKYIDAHGGDSALGKVASYLQSADLALLNLEGPISDKGTKLSWKDYTFRSRLALAQGLANAGVDVVSLANNHAMDCGSAALLDTIQRLDAVGVKHAGGGEDITAARAPAIVETPAGKVAVLGFTDKAASGFAAGAEHPGSAMIGDGSKVVEAIQAAKQKADFVIVIFHWGTEYTFNAAGYQRSLAHRCVDAGADLIIGSHPHVIQGIELYKDKLIAYSMGDFVFDHRPGPTGQTFILRVTLKPGQPPVARIIPLYLDNTYGIPAVVTGDTADTILNRLISLSKGFGTTITRSGDQAWIGQTEPAE